MSRLRNFKFLANNLILLSGRRVVIVCILGIAVGIGMGICEIAFGLSLEKFLSSYGLLERGENSSDWLSNGMDPLIFVLVMAVVLTIFRYFSLFVPNYVLEYFSHRVRQLVNNETIREEGDISDISVANVSHIMTNLSPATANLISAVSFLLLSIVRLFVLLAGLFVLSTELSLISIAAIGVFGIPTLFLRSKFVHYSTVGYRESAKFTENLIRNVRNVIYLKLSGRIAEENRILGQNSSLMFKILIKYNVIYFANNVWPGLLSISVVVLVIIINYRENFTPESFLVPFVYLLSRIAASISDLSGNYARFQLYKPAFVEFITYNILLLKDRSYQEKKNNINISEPESFSVEHLSIGRNEVLREDINITLRRGESLLISGESGSGKTTFIYTILGLIHPLGGRVLWNGTDIFDINQGTFRPHISYSGSDPFLFDATIEQNIRSGQEDTDRKKGDIEKVLEISCCSFIDKLDDKLAHRLKEGGEGVSAGQKQRISLARALIKEPQVLLLDEATSNIDTVTEKKIFEGIKEAFPEMIIIFVSHRESSREFATKILDV